MRGGGRLVGGRPSAVVIALAAVVGGAVARAGWGLAAHPAFDHIYSDMAGYVERARRVAEGADLSRYDVFQPTGTQLILALPFELFGDGRSGLWAAAVLWVALSAATPFFAWRLARLLWGPAAGAVAATATAGFPLFVLHVGWFASETPAIALLTGALWLGYRARLADPGGRLGSAVAGGLMAGGAVAVRPQLALNLAILIAPWLLARTRLRQLAAYGTATAMVAAGVIAFNSAAADRPTFFGENGGLVFFQGACEVGFMSGGLPERPFYFIPPPRSEQMRGRSYAFPGILVWDQRFWYEQSWQCIRDNGVAHGAVMARNVVDMTATSTPWPEREDGGLVRALAWWSNLAWSLCIPLLVGGVLLGRIRDGSFGATGPIALQFLSFVVVGAIFFGDPRFRLPYDAVGLVLLAGLLAERGVLRRPGFIRVP